MLSRFKYFVQDLVEDLVDDVDDISDDEDELLFEEDDSLTRESEWKDGVVTEVQFEYFLIDNAVLWPKTICLGPPRFGNLNLSHVEVGFEVHYLRSRAAAHEEWRIVEVHPKEVEDQWMDSAPIPKWVMSNGDGAQYDQIAVIEKVKKPYVTLRFLPGSSGQTQPNMEVNWKECGPDYIPWRGDMLSVKLEIDKKGKQAVSVMKPLRLDEGAGEVTFWDSREEVGLVSDVIFFAKDTASHSYSPKRGDNVRYYAIECQTDAYKRNCMWRAIRVVPRLKGYRPNTVVPSEERLLQKETLDELLREKNQVSLKCQDPPPFDVNESKVVIVDIINEAAIQASVESIVASCNKARFGKGNKIEFQADLPLVIAPRSSTTISLICTGGTLGHSKEIVTFSFKDFDLGMVVNFNVGSDILNNMIPKDSTFDRFGTARASCNGQIVPGQKRSNAKTPKFLPYRLPSYDVPKFLWRDAMECESDTILDLNPVLGEPLNFLNYANKFSVLLHLEEIANDQRMQQFWMKAVIFEHHGPYLKLEIPGLCEKRPSLMLGDSIIASPAKQVLNKGNMGTKFEGCIHEVRSTSVLLKFEQTFQNTYCGEMYDVEFKLNRAMLRRMHLAVESAKKMLGQQVLFPSDVKVSSPQVDIKTYDVSTAVLKYQGMASSAPKFQPRQVFPTFECDSEQFVTPVLPLTPPNSQTMKISLPPPCDTKSFRFDLDDFVQPYTSHRLSGRSRKHQWFNKKLNHEQKLAVERILKGEARPLPYIIYGPPGTGKTITVVEAILQIYYYRPNSRILVATPTNSAADLILERLWKSKQIRPGQMARLVPFQRSEDSIPEELQPFCFVNDEIEVLRAVAMHRIVITTCSTAGGFFKLSFRNGHFTHCFIDEAGHTTEPEAMIPLSLLACDRDGQIILAGDPQQLGPVLQSTFAKMYGLEESLLERMCNSILYQRDDIAFKGQGGYDPLLVTKLLKNYRSHGSIIQIPSALFYDSELQTCASNRIKKRFLKLPFLPNRKHPIIFHGVQGKNYQEEDSPSWFNPVEALQVVHYLKKLQELGVDTEDIGVIAPYRKQIDKIRRLIDTFDLDPVKIGSVEEFQGQERPVIILTTVRSGWSEENVAFDVIHGLGFVQSAKRLNVALTRAQSLLILVGDPHMLEIDSNWRAFLKFCIENCCYIGCNPPILGEVD